MPDSTDLCGISGLDNDPVTVGQVNRLTAEVKFYHYRPLTKAIDRVTTALETQEQIMREHIEADAKFFNQLRGAKIALYAILGAFGAILAFGYKMLEALHILLGGM